MGLATGSRVLGGWGADSDWDYVITREEFTKARELCPKLHKIAGEGYGNDVYSIKYEDLGQGKVVNLLVSEDEEIGRAHV